MVSNIFKDVLPHFTFKIFQVPFWTSTQHGWLQSTSFVCFVAGPQAFAQDAATNVQDPRFSVIMLHDLGTVETLTAYHSITQSLNAPDSR